MGREVDSLLVVFIDVGALLLFLLLLLLLLVGDFLDGRLLQDIRVLRQDVSNAKFTVGDGSQVSGGGLSSGLHHTVEDSFVVLQQLLGRLELDNAASVKYKYAIAIDNGDESVSDGKNSTLLEVSTDHALEHSIGLNVERSGSLVEKQDVRIEEQAASHGQELALTHGEVSSVLVNVSLKASIKSGDEILESNHVQYVPDLLIFVLTEGVQVVANSTHKELRNLRDDGKTTAEIVETNSIDINVINKDTSSSGLGGTEESSDESRLSGSSTSDDSNLLARLDGSAKTVQDRYTRLVSNSEVVEDDLTLGRPIGVGLSLRDFVGLLLLNIVVLQNTLGGVHTSLELSEEEGESSKQGDDGDRVGASGNGQRDVVALGRVDAEEDEHQEDTSDDDRDGGVGHQVEPLSQTTKRQKV